MAALQGTCPSCGAPIEFGVGSSTAKICEFCRATVVREGQDLQSLGKVAELARVPSLISVGDAGTLAGYPFVVMGRLQLDHGKGPWDEYYLSYSGGQAWGWLAYDDGNWYATSPVEGCPIPPYASLHVEMNVALGQYGHYRVAEVKSGKVASAEGELPFPVTPGDVFYYADLRGPKGAFATLDYGDNTGEYDVFIGRVFYEYELSVTQAGPRHVAKAATEHVQCMGCGGELTLQSGSRAERVGCGYCGAVNDLVGLQVVAQQEKARSQPELPLGTRATFGGTQYVVIAYLRRSIKIEGERYPWEEYLLWAEGAGFRWVVKNEGSWLWVESVSVGDLDLDRMPNQVGYAGKIFSHTEKGKARIDYVLGEVFWKAEVGEKVKIRDYKHKGEVLTRELSSGDGEVQWSYSRPVPWKVLEQGLQR